MKRIVAVACLLLFIGCGSDEGSESTDAAQTKAAPAARVVACDILTNQEVAEVIGGTVTNADPREIGDDDTRYLSMCTYSAESGGALKTATLSVKRAPEVRDPAAALNSQIEGLRAEMPGYQATPVADYGPGAAWNEELLTLSVFRAGWSLDVVVDRQAARPPLEAAKALMSKTLERLP